VPFSGAFSFGVDSFRGKTSSYLSPFLPISFATLACADRSGNRLTAATLRAMANNTLLKLINMEGQSEPEAADDLARVVETILKRLRKGEVVTLPGLGKLVPGAKSTFRLEKLTKEGARGRR
jgi:hypothetical protein